MSDTTRVFISAVSAEFGDARRGVRDTLTTKEVLPIVQDNFPPDHRAVRDILRSAIGKCDAVVCLVGQHYGREPEQRADGEPRRSYTQLEYETAVELEKPVFLFVYRGDPPESAPLESDEFRRLQLSYLHRLAESDQIRLPFASEQELREQVALIDFTSDGLRSGVHRTTAVLLHASIDSAAKPEGNDCWVTDAAQPWLRQVAAVRSEFGGNVYEEHAGTCVLRFANSEAACNAGLSLQQRVENELPDVRCRVAIHSGEIVQFRGVSLSNALNVSRASGVCQSLNELCGPGQVLLTRAAFDEARQLVRTHPNPSTDHPLQWVSHGRFLVKGTDADSEAIDESIEVCEVGLRVTRPADTQTMISADSFEQERMRGWRPSIGQPIPSRENWIIERKLGEGGFGEVWLARHNSTKQKQVFKFCFDADRLRSFKRELTVFRLLDGALGDRIDIAHLGEVQLEKPPFYLESEYIEAGNLIDWAETQGGLGSIPLDERLRITQEICTAVAAAHSVGVFHRDLKPSNIFMRQDASGVWHPLLADFGIGALADKTLLDQHSITHASLMQSMLIGSSKGSGTRMYKPPEAETGDQRGTTQADVYALGVMLYQMATADFTRPAGIGWEESLQQSTESTDSAQFDVRSHLLRQDIRAAIHVDPQSRLSSAAELTNRLQTLPERTEAEAARRDTDRIRQRNRRLRNLLTVTALSLLIVGGLSVLSFIQWQKATAAANAEKLANENIRNQNEQIGKLNSSLEEKIEEVTEERDEKEHQRSVAQQHLYDLQRGNAQQAALQDNVPLQHAWLQSAIEVGGDGISAVERGNIAERLGVTEARMPVLERTLNVRAPCVRVATDLNGRFVAAFSRDTPSYGPVLYDVDSGERVLGPLANHGATPAQFIAIDDAGLRLAYVYGSSNGSSSTLVFWNLQTALPIGDPITLAGEVTSVWFQAGFPQDVRVVTVQEQAEGQDEMQVARSEVRAYQVDVTSNPDVTAHAVTSPGEIFRVHKSPTGNSVLVAFMQPRNMARQFSWTQITFGDEISSAPVTALSGREVASFAGESDDRILSVDSDGRLQLVQAGSLVDTDVSLPPNTGHMANINRTGGFCLLASPESISTSSQPLSQADPRTQLYVVSRGSDESARIRLLPIQVAGFPTSYTGLPENSELCTEYAIGTNSGHVYFGLDDQISREGRFLPVHHNSPIVAVKGLGGDRVLTASEDGQISIWKLEESELRNAAAARIERLEIEPVATAEMWQGINRTEANLRRLDVFGELSIEGLYFRRGVGDRSNTLLRGDSVEELNDADGLSLPENFSPISGFSVGAKYSLVFEDAAIPRHPTELISIGVRQVRPDLVPELLQLTFRGTGSGRIALCNHEKKTVAILDKMLPGSVMHFWATDDGEAVVVGNAFDGTSGFVAKFLLSVEPPRMETLSTNPVLDVNGNGSLVYAIDSRSQLLRIDARKDKPSLSGTPQLGSLHGLAVSKDGLQVVAWSESDLYRTQFQAPDYVRAESTIGDVRELHFSPDGKTIVGYSDDNIIGVLDAETLQTITAHKSEMEIEGLAIAPDGRSAVLAEETPFLSDKERQRTLGFAMDRRRRLRHVTLPELDEIVPDLGAIDALPIRARTVEKAGWVANGQLLYNVPVRNLNWSLSGERLYIVQGRRVQVNSPLYAPSTIKTIPIEILHRRDVPRSDYGVRIDKETLQVTKDLSSSELGTRLARFRKLLQIIDDDSQLSAADVSFLTEELIQTRDLSGCWKVGDSLYSQRRFAEALPIYNCAYQLNRKSLPNAIRFARCLIQYHPDTAAIVLSEAIDKRLGDKEYRDDGYIHAAHSQLANAYASLGKWQEAAVEFDQHIEVPMFQRMLGDADTATNILGRATYVALRTEQSAKAQRYVRMMLALARDSLDPAAWANLSEHLWIVREQVANDELFKIEELLRTGKPDSGGRIMLAIEFIERGLSVEAEKSLKEIRSAIEGAPSLSRQQPEYLLSVAESLLAKQQGNAAMASRLAEECRNAWTRRLMESQRIGLPSFTYAELLHRFVGIDDSGIARQVEIPRAKLSPLEAVPLQSPMLAGDALVSVATHYFQRGRHKIAAETCERGFATLPRSAETDAVIVKLQLLWVRSRLAQLYLMITGGK